VVGKRAFVLVALVRQRAKEAVAVSSNLLQLQPQGAQRAAKSYEALGVVRRARRGAVRATSPAAAAVSSGASLPAATALLAAALVATDFLTAHRNGQVPDAPADKWLGEITEKIIHRRFIILSTKGTYEG